MTLQVFEYQKLHIGERLSQQQWQALAAFGQRHSEKYFKILHNGIQFTNYVGALQIGDLTIEVLPKIEEAGTHELQNVLIEMLKECSLLKLERTGIASLQKCKGTLLEIYIDQFLNEIVILLKQGLARSYVTEAQNRKTFKGKILLHKQLEQNIAHPERFYTQSAEFSYDIPFNQILYSALLTLKELPLRIELADEVQQLVQLFPVLQRWTLPLPKLQSVRFSRQTIRYKTALEIALLILQDAQPNLRAGQLSVVAILFDMNFLFEEFIFRQLQKVAHEKITVQRHVPKPFWNHRSIQPDILLTMGNQNIVIDTKWKKLQKVSPAMEDLRQMYAYNQYFEAQHSVIVYPYVPGLEDLPPAPFHSAQEKPSYFCQVRLVELVRDGQLNRTLGQELLSKVLMIPELFAPIFGV